MGGSVENYLGFDWQPPSVFFGSQAGGYPPFASTNGPGVTFAGVNNGSGHYVGHLYLYMRELATGIVSLYLDIGTTVLNPTFGFSSTGFSLPVGYEIAGFVLVNDADQTQVFLRWLWTAVSSSAPVISASLQQNNLDVTVPVSVTNLAVSYVFPSTTFSGPGSQGPFTYTIDYNDGVTDSFTTSSTTHAFTHTYLDTTPKIIRVQISEAGITTTIIDDFNRANGPSLGSQWQFSNPGGLVGITSNAAMGWTPASGNLMFVGIDCGGADGTIEGTIASYGSGDIALMFRASSKPTNNPILYSFWYTDKIGVTLYQDVAFDNNGFVRNGFGTVTTISSWAPLTTAPDTFRIDLNGSSITITDLGNSNILYSGTNSALESNTIHGFGLTSTNTFFDNFSAMTTSPTLYSNTVLLYPTWVSGSATFGSNRIGFRSPSNRRTL